MSQRKDTGLTTKPWPILLDHYKPIVSHTDRLNIKTEYKWIFERRKNGFLGALNFKDKMIVDINIIDNCISLRTVSLNEKVFQQTAFFEFIPID